MSLPSMPSLSDLPREELRKIHVVLEIFEDDFGEIHDPHGDTAKKGCYMYTIKPYTRCIPVKNNHFL